MKAEHRHELQQNELQKLAERARGFFERWGNHLLIGVSALVLITAVVVYLVRSSRAATSARWSALVAATESSELLNVAETYEGTSVEAWARLRAAEASLREGIRLQFVNREASHSELESAAEDFERVLQNTNAPAEARERALYGLATAREATSEGKLEKAVELYEQLLEEFPETVYKPVVESRLEQLKSGQAGEFYAWFAEQNPNPADRREPLDGHPPFSPADLPLPKVPEDLRLREPAEAAGDGSEPGPALTVPSTTEEKDDQNGDADAGKQDTDETGTGDSGETDGNGDATSP